MIETKNYDFDAIVVGSGITGGWAAKELTERGLKVLVLERGRDIVHGSDYVGEHTPAWKLPYHGKPPRGLYDAEYEVQRKNYAFNEANRHFWNNDKENPYSLDEGQPFDWFRSDTVGGRSLTWARQSYRWSEQDFRANEQDGHGIPWPVGYNDIAPWYSHVEKFIGVSGKKEGLSQLPDGEFQKSTPWFALEETIKQRLSRKAPDVTLTSSRVALLTEDLPGRAACHYCGPCHNGCSTGSYFSSQCSTLPAARATGNLTLKSDALVERLEVDANTGLVSKVLVVDTKSGARQAYTAKLVFLCASTIASTQVLLNSTSDQFPNGLANSSGTLGHYLMDHPLGPSAFGFFLDNMDSYFFGYRPNGLYIPRFRNVGKQDDDLDFVRGYGYQTMTLRRDWTMQFNQEGFGAGLKNNLRKPGFWLFAMLGFAECLPQQRNRMYLSKDKVDRFGVPQVVFDMEWSDNERALWQDGIEQATRLMRAAGAVYFISGDGKMSTPGAGIHEMGTARMGNDPAESVLNRYNQAHEVPNLFVTDGSFMTSSSCVNPSLTYMAFTARACNYAADRLAQGGI